MPMLWARRRPETKGAIHVYPGVIFASDRNQFSEKIESADIQITSLQQQSDQLACLSSDWFSDAPLCAGA